MKIIANRKCPSCGKKVGWFKRTTATFDGEWSCKSCSTVLTVNSIRTMFAGLVGILLGTVVSIIVFISPAPVLAIPIILMYIIITGLFFQDVVINTKALAKKANRCLRILAYFILMLGIAISFLHWFFGALIIVAGVLVELQSRNSSFELVKKAE